MCGPRATSCFSGPHTARLVGLVGLAVVLAGLPAPAPAAAQGDRDYDPTSSSWNGLSRFLAIGTEEGVAIEPVQRLDLGTLGIGDGLLIVCPASELPVEGITEMLRAGGRVALADDFGTGDTLLRAFRIDRHDAA